jgi:hypothetical protein
MSAKRKTCSACGKVKSATVFRPGNNQCAQCQRLVQDRWVKANPEKRKAYQRKYLKTHKQEIKEQRARWYLDNREKAAERNRLYYEAHREKRLASANQYAEDNREQMAEYKRRHYKANRVKLMENSRQYQATHREEVRQYKRQYKRTRRAALKREKVEAAAAAHIHLKRFWSPENLARLGKEPDRTIANSMGLTSAAVGHMRRKLGIPPRSKPQPRWTKAMISRLGKEPDAVVAGTLGIGFRAIVSKRRSLGIPGWRKK